MGLRVNTNTQSIAAHRALTATAEAQKRSIEKLASGTRINRAADDAAGLAISENMKAQIRSIRQDIRNGMDGISMVQVAEGGLQEIGNILTRFRELSIQAASDTIGDTERGFIDKEVQQLAVEVDRIANSTEFNGRKLLSGEGDVLELQIGIRNNPELDRLTIDTSKTEGTLSYLGLDGISTADKTSAQDNLDNIDEAITRLSENRAELGALQNKMESSVNNLRIYDENLSAARSRIYDVDMASESAELVKQNILAQSGVVVLSQANHNTELALKLL